MRLSDLEYEIVKSRAKARGISMGTYLKWMMRKTVEGQDDLELIE